MRNPDAKGPLLELVGENASQVHVRTLDVDSDESVESCFRSILATSRIDALVNNAGVGGGGPVEETPIETFRSCLETNFFGLLRCTKAVLPTMREQRSGCIVNVSSVAGRIGIGGHGAYAVSKFAVEGLSEVLSQGVPACVVGDRIREIIESDGGAIQYPAGPDAEPLLVWRASKTGKEWAEIGALDNDSWAAEIQAALGLDVRSYLDS